MDPSYFKDLIVHDEDIGKAHIKLHKHENGRVSYFPLVKDEAKIDELVEAGAEPEVEDDAKKQYNHSDFNRGRRRSNSLCKYRPIADPVLDRDGMIASFKDTTKDHINEAQMTPGGLRHPKGDDVMAEWHNFVAKRPHCRDEKGDLKTDMFG